MRARQVSDHMYLGMVMDIQSRYKALLSGSYQLRGRRIHVVCENLSLRQRQSEIEFERMAPSLSRVERLGPNRMCGAWPNADTYTPVTNDYTLSKSCICVENCEVYRTHATEWNRNI